MITSDCPGKDCPYIIRSPRLRKRAERGARRVMFDTLGRGMRELELEYIVNRECWHELVFLVASGKPICLDYALFHGDTEAENFDPRALERWLRAGLKLGHVPERPVLTGTQERALRGFQRVEKRRPPRRSRF